MLTQKYRPTKFADVYGAEVPKKVLQAIIKNPHDAPRSILLSGAWGAGKTTSARIFGRALNCKTKSGDACLRCESCKSMMTESPLYTELDSAMVGNVEMMKGLRDTLTYSVRDGYRVVVFDETHLVSKAAQSALLTVLESAPPGIFYLFCTTDPERLLNTILSRSLILEYRPIPNSGIMSLMQEISEKENKPFSKEVFEYIARRARGHARDALMQMELAILLGEKDFIDVSVSLDLLFGEFLAALKAGSLSSVKGLVNKIVEQPLVIVEQDFDSLVSGISDRLFIDKTEDDKRLRELVFFYLKNRRYLRSTNDWHIFLTSLASLFEKKVTTAPVQNRFSKS